MGYNVSLAIGVALLIASLIVFRKSLVFIKKSEKTIAKVVELAELKDSEGTLYAPVFWYKTNTGKEFRYQDNALSSPSSWFIGEEVKIAYIPSEPTKPMILTYFNTFGWAIILLVFAMPCIVVGGGYYVAQVFLR
ncbi:DUF3592 domain-containing protein [Pedobacter nototheniae]|uniref:DUF3592 domain-containing protein n=1 Tax=Pedobacter nototheniae TaxID=2488994 RepID=UPI00292CF6B8|nr:DUF3592 domain-containing protein [Pedobacter nototheniae]